MEEDMVHGSASDLSNNQQVKLLLLIRLFDSLIRTSKSDSKNYHCAFAINTILERANKTNTSVSYELLDVLIREIEVTPTGFIEGVTMLKKAGGGTNEHFLHYVTNYKSRHGV